MESFLDSTLMVTSSSGRYWGTGGRRTPSPWINLVAVQFCLGLHSVQSRIRHPKWKIMATSVFPDSDSDSFSLTMQHTYALDMFVCCQWQSSGLAHYDGFVSLSFMLCILHGCGNCVSFYLFVVIWESFVVPWWIIVALVNVVKLMSAFVVYIAEMEPS